ncbi:hypothetical protein ABEB36_001648 [Hypothenemus hampei]|uniref:Uncharacterized protein n=1 Tax=Hypothenemus hampei TaxID=57062 RepID=A0ABD1FFV3_HYPHA
MKSLLEIFFILIVVVLLICNYISYNSGTSSSSKFPSHRSDFYTKIPDGIWKNKREWKFQWVKEWHEKKVQHLTNLGNLLFQYQFSFQIFVPVWKKIWTPVEINEWVPLPSSDHK